MREEEKEIASYNNRESRKPTPTSRDRRTPVTPMTPFSTILYMFHQTICKLQQTKTKIHQNKHKI